MNSEKLDHTDEGHKKQRTGVLLSTGVGISIAISSFLSDGNHTGLGTADMNGGSKNSSLDSVSEIYPGYEPTGDVTSVDPGKNVTPTPITFGRGYMGPYGVNAKE